MHAEGGTMEIRRLLKDRGWLISLSVTLKQVTMLGLWAIGGNKVSHRGVVMIRAILPICVSILCRIAFAGHVRAII